LSYSSPHKT